MENGPLSRTRPHKAAAIVLIVLAALSSFVFVYAFTAHQGVLCPLYARPFQDSTMPPRTVFQLAPPGEATICLTVETSGQLPLGSLSLAPELGIYTASRSMSSYSACSNSWTNCGGVTASAAPASAFLSSKPVHIVVTINAPGSTRGVYWLWFWPCSGGTVLWLRIGRPNQTLQSSLSVLQCLHTAFQVSLSFNSYSGMIPLYQNGTVPLL